MIGHHQVEMRAAAILEKRDVPGLAPEKVDPDDFIRWGFRKLLDHRLPRYRAMADNWGITVSAHDVAKVRTKDDFEDLIARSLEKQA